MKIKMKKLQNECDKFMEPKYKRCKHNSNRHAHEYANPFCRWKDQFDGKMPPNIYLMQTTNTTEEHCRVCEVFESITEELPELPDLVTKAEFNPQLPTPEEIVRFTEFLRIKKEETFNGR